MKRRMDLRLFEGGDGSGGQGGGSGNGGSGHEENAGATYSYEQADEIANARAAKAERAALANYFRSQGMTEDEITSAINDFKAKKKANEPNVSQIERERDEYKIRSRRWRMKNIFLLRASMRKILIMFFSRLDSWWMIKQILRKRLKLS